MRIPSWRRWPTEVFTVPAGAGVNITIYTMFVPESGMPLMQALAFGFLFALVPTVLGVAIAATLFALRGPGPRLRDTRLARRITHPTCHRH